MISCTSPTALSEIRAGDRLRTQLCDRLPSREEEEQLMETNGEQVALGTAVQDFKGLLEDGQYCSLNTAADCIVHCVCAISISRLYYRYTKMSTFFHMCIIPQSTSTL